MKIENIAVRNFRCFGPDWMEISLEEQVTAFVEGTAQARRRYSRRFPVSLE